VVKVKKKSKSPFRKLLGKSAAFVSGFPMMANCDEIERTMVDELAFFYTPGIELIRLEMYRTIHEKDPRLSPCIY
jgi:hypothetical protein